MSNNTNTGSRTLFIIALLITTVVSYIAGCARGEKTGYQNSTTDTVTVTDSTLKLQYDSTAKVMSTGHVPDTVYLTGEPVFIPAHVDTAATLYNYYARWVNIDSMRNNELAIYITDTISRNRVLKRNLNYKILRPDSIITITTTQTITTKEAASGLYVGAQVGANGSNLLLAPHLLYTTKNKWAFSLGVSLNQGYPIVGIYYKIK
ncbi:MAG: hypothetical protein V4538_01810 [Bacteroidota bacterium]